MTITRYIATGIAAVGLLSASTAFAGEATRSAAALPTGKIALKRINGLNRAGKSVTDENHAIVGVALIAILVAGASVTAAIIVVATDSNG